MAKAACWTKAQSLVLLREDFTQCPSFSGKIMNFYCSNVNCMLKIVSTLDTVKGGDDILSKKL